MKRTLSFLTVLAVFAMATPSFAGSPAEKFKSGIKDVITSPKQICDNLQAETKGAKFFPFAFIGGLAKGIFYMGKQIITGTLDVVMSPLEAVKMEAAAKK